MGKDWKADKSPTWQAQKNLATQSKEAELNRLRQDIETLETALGMLNSIQSHDTAFESGIRYLGGQLAMLKWQLYHMEG